MVISFLLSFVFDVEKFTLMFPISALIVLTTVLTLSSHFNFRQVLLFAYSTIWGLRLTFHLSRRILVDKIDSRLNEMRENPWKKIGFFLGMGLMSFACVLPFVLVDSIKLELQPAFGVMDAIGIVFWLGGFILEFVADLQLFKWNHSPETAGSICDKGLWARMRHPNYFGEFLEWWGIFMLSTRSLMKTEWLIVLAPLFISVMVLFVSGIPPADRQLRQEHINDTDLSTYLKQSGMYFPKLGFQQSIKTSRTGTQKTIGESLSPSAISSSSSSSDSASASVSSSETNSFSPSKNASPAVPSTLNWNSALPRPSPSSAASETAQLAAMQFRQPSQETEEARQFAHPDLIRRDIERERERDKDKDKEKDRDRDRDREKSRSEIEKEAEKQNDEERKEANEEDGQQTEEGNRSDVPSKQAVWLKNSSGALSSEGKGISD